VSGDPLDLELATTALLADNHDVRVLLKLLARQLAGTLGERVEVVRDGSRFRKSEEVRSLRVAVGSDEYAADVAKGMVTTSIGHNSGGIRIRTERVGTEEWLSRLLAGLRQEAESNQASRMAIETIVMGGRS
jgi:hypothetical protein